MNYGGGSPSMSCRWIWRMVALFDGEWISSEMALFTKFIGYDLKGPLTHVRADGTYGACPY
jgi:hypothetical protein